MIALKLFHILFLFMWVGTLLALSRLLGYLPKEEERIQKKMLAIYRRMYLFLDLPSMILALTLGVAYLVMKGIDMKQGWLHMKFTFAFLLVVSDIFIGRAILKAKIKGKGKRFKIFHSMAAFSLIAILVSIYIIKAKSA